MNADMIQVKDIRSIGLGGSLTVHLPDYHAVVSAKNQVCYVKKAYPPPKGYQYYCRTVGNTITIGLAETEKVNNKAFRNTQVIK
jgi:hypothetical protein